MPFCESLIFRAHRRLALQNWDTRILYLANVHCFAGDVIFSHVCLVSDLSNFNFDVLDHWKFFVAFNELPQQKISCVTIGPLNSYLWIPRCSCHCPSETLTPRPLCPSDSIPMASRPLQLVQNDLWSKGKMMKIQLSKLVKKSVFEKYQPLNYAVGLGSRIMGIGLEGKDKAASSSRTHKGSFSASILLILKKHFIISMFSFPCCFVDFSKLSWRKIGKILSPVLALYAPPLAPLYSWRAQPRPYGPAEGCAVWDRKTWSYSAPFSGQKQKMLRFAWKSFLLPMFW